MTRRRDEKPVRLKSLEVFNYYFYSFDLCIQGHVRSSNKEKKAWHLTLS
jgi:hypothetical protein